MQKQISRPGSPSLGVLAHASPGMTDVVWVGADRISAVALPTVMRKIIAHALDDGGTLFRHAEVRGRPSRLASLAPQDDGRASKHQVKSARRR
jgi:hypothetical protein